MRTELPARKFHVVFTLPSTLRPVVFAHRSVLLGLLFRAASQTLLAFAADAKWLGAQLGFTLVLHKSISVPEMLPSASDVGMNRILFDRYFTSIVDSQTTLPEDHEMIVETFASTFGSIAASDRFVRETIQAAVRKPGIVINSQSGGGLAGRCATPTTTADAFGDAARVCACY